METMKIYLYEFDEYARLDNRLKQLESRIMEEVKQIPFGRRLNFFYDYIKPALLYLAGWERKQPEPTELRTQKAYDVVYGHFVGLCTDSSYRKFVREKRRDVALKVEQENPRILNRKKQVSGLSSTGQKIICMAKTRRGTPCKRRDLYASGRCRLHGGLSTGPKTPEGKARSSQNGFYGGRKPNSMRQGQNGTF